MMMNKIVKKTLIGITIIIAIGVIGYTILHGIVWYQFNVGCGMDDGPFKAIKIENHLITDNHKIYKLKKGELILDNRNDSLSPIILYKEKGKIEWILDTDVRNTKGYETCRISSINDLKIINDSNKIEIEFYAVWTYGAESGWMKIDKNGGDNKFCLSW
ncbi:hypothetical protein SAMN05444411_12010 [Lutibacter oricola]|uniref:Uncharacterized protein n=2 Tax=Lutibacter oricola TaxID=762486 RepID=A0A1H3GZD3_9FLAO|nr:hypothetical protein SAMN05444411_12010 [Lutibacter oricola]